MTQIHLLEELERFSVIERLKFVEAALNLIREDLQENIEVQTNHEKELTMAAETLLPEYTAGSELTIFTVLDSEDINETE